MGTGLLLAAVPWTWFLGATRWASSPTCWRSCSLCWWRSWPCGGLVGCRRRPALMLAVSTLVAGTAAAVGPWLPADEGAVAGRGVTVAGTNVDGNLTAGRTLLDLAADVLVVPEVSADGVRDLDAAHPYRYIRIDDDDDPDIAVFSRYPLWLVEPVGPDLPGGHLEVAGPDGRFVLYALHVPRPWYSGEVEASYQATVPEHRRLVEEVAARLRTRRSRSCSSGI